MRSKLFVPGSREKLFIKAMESDADAISFDLEDSVVEARKTEARENVALFLQSPEITHSRKVIIVRTNGLDTPHFEDDIMAIAQAGLSMLNLPKVDRPDDIGNAIEKLEQAERANGLTDEIQIIANIETADGFLNAAEIAQAHPRVVGLQLALNDLFGPLEMDRKDIKNVHAAMFRVRMAAGTAGIFTYDGAFADIEDEVGFREEAEMAFRMGYMGKSCIHPRQIAMTNEIFTPSVEEIELSRRVLDAARKADKEGVGAFTSEGMMIDLPIIRRAESIMATVQNMSNSIDCKAKL